MKVIIEKNEFQAAAQFTLAAMKAAAELLNQRPGEIESFSEMLEEYERVFGLEDVSDAYKARRFLEYSEKNNVKTGQLMTVEFQDDGSIVIWVNPELTVRTYEILTDEVDFVVGILTSLYGLVKMFKSRMKKVNDKLNKLVSDLAAK